MKIGITERGDAGLNIFEWSYKLPQVDCAILITKNLNDDFINTICTVAHKVIVHVTCTGYGNTRLEPNVPSKEWTYHQVFKAKALGFPVSQMVLRIDPIIPTQKGLVTASDVLQLFADTGIDRVRYSFLQMYPHAKERFTAAGVRIPYETFLPPQQWQDECVKMLNTMHSGRYNFESCAINNEHKVGCISNKDTEILGLGKVSEFRSGQRKSCLCPVGKTELLSAKKQCPHGCLYCYWKG